MLTKKRYNKKGFNKFSGKKKRIKSKKQRGGFICQAPNVINVQSSYFNKSNDKKVNSQAYTVYVDECYRYSSCVFDNINNIDLIIKLLEILKEILNTNAVLKYKSIVDTSRENYNNKYAIERRIPKTVFTQNENILNSKFLDIYVTSLLQWYFELKFTDTNTVFLQKDDYDFIINEDFSLAKNLIISRLINLEDNLLIRSLLQILSNTFKILIQDKYLLKDSAIHFSKILAEINTRQSSIVTCNFLFISILHLFLFCFSKHITTFDVTKKSYTVLCLIYKIIYSYVTKIIDKSVEHTDNFDYVLPFLNDDNLNQFIIGNNFTDIEKLPIFAHLINTLTSIDCIISSFLKPERFRVLCNELDGYFTRNEPFNRLYDVRFISEGCITSILLQGWSMELIREIYNYMRPQ